MTIYDQRLARLREHLGKSKAGGMLVSHEPNVHYVSGFTGSESCLLVTAQRGYLITDSRYFEQACRSAKGWEVLRYRNSAMECGGKLARKHRLRKLLYEDYRLDVARFVALRRTARGVRLAPARKPLEALRQVKTAEEIAAIRQAIQAQSAAYRWLRRRLRPGMAEREIAEELRYRMVRHCGAEDQAFPAIVAVGAHASQPHALPSGRRLRADSLVLIDWGAKVRAYCSDLTRSFFLGRIPPRWRRIFEVVRQAQARALEALRPGVALSQVDRAAREVIAKAGYGQRFGHGSGHGIGLEVHEEPQVSPRSKAQAIPGMVLTIEPGIYLPGLGGVRLEDDVLVTESGHEVLSDLPQGIDD